MSAEEMSLSTECNMLEDFHQMGEDLERSIITLEETLTLKSSQLEETRRRLRKEIVEHQMMKNCLDKKIKEMDNVRLELELNVKANAKLEEENAKIRETTAKLQTQMDLYMVERKILTDQCHNSNVNRARIKINNVKIEVCKLKNQVNALQDKLDEHNTFAKLYQESQLNTKSLINQILRKQEILNKEQTRLDGAVKDGLEFASRLSDELNVQSLFVKEANVARIQLENELGRLIGVLKAERNERRQSARMGNNEDVGNYLADWKSSQAEASVKIKNLTEENRKLVEELEDAKARMDLMMEKDTFV